MLRVHYPELFADDSENLPRARELAERSWELVSFLVDVCGMQAVVANWQRTITYHDACNLGRYNDIYDDPRRVLAGVTRGELVEMKLNRSKGFCCGGGGGRAWVEENEGRRVNQLRVEQAMEVKPDILASACPFCLTMFEDGVKAKEVGDKIKTRDIAELLAERLG